MKSESQLFELLLAVRLSLLFPMRSENSVCERVMKSKSQMSDITKLELILSSIFLLRHLHIEYVILQQDHYIRSVFVLTENNQISDFISVSQF